MRITESGYECASPKLDGGLSQEEDMDACYNACADMDKCHFYIYDFITKECDKYSECIPKEDLFNSGSKAIYQEQCNFSVLIYISLFSLSFEHIVRMQKA